MKQAVAAANHHHQLRFQRTLRKVPNVAVAVVFLSTLFTLITYSPLHFRYGYPTPPSPSSPAGSRKFNPLQNSVEFPATKPHRESDKASGESSTSSIQNDLPSPKTLEAANGSSSDSLTLSVPSRSVNKAAASSGRSVGAGNESCDLFSGEWVPNPEGPYYTNATCHRIQDHQNCMKYGRPDTGYLRWRWKPDGCELPIFDPHRFMELVRGKSMAFVGDSVGRNHMQSLMCLLSRVAYPIDLSPSDISQDQHWVYEDDNFNISMFWAPYLVRSQTTNPNDVTSPYKLYLDEFDHKLTSKLQGYNYIFISAAQWFLRPSLYYEKGRFIGCHACKIENATQLVYLFGYEKAFRTAFRAINGLEDFKGATFLRTVIPSHFEGGVWDQGGDCVRTRPFTRNETVLEDYNREMLRIQLQELRIAEEEGSKKGLRFRLFDVTNCMQMRPDGHPSKYGHWPHEKVTNDCVHWCLPGPIDTLNDFLLQLLEREERNQFPVRFLI